MTEIQTTELRALVTLTVAPKPEQSLADASSEMLQQFKEYLTECDRPFLGDYGATTAELAAFRDDPDADEPTWGGYEGPYVVAVDVRNADDPVSDGAEWHRQMGDQYARIALESDNAAVKTANAAEAAKYYGIAERLASVTARTA